MIHCLPTSCRLGAALLVAAAGILGAIDVTTMIVLTVFLTCMPDRRTCFGARAA